MALLEKQTERLRPPFLMAPMPGAEQPEFLLMNAFIARERQNLTGILIARSDPPHYGELVLLEMPRDDQIRAAPERALLGAHGDAAVHGRDADARVAREVVRVVRDLRGELARRRQDQRAHAPAAGVAGLQAL